MGGFSCVFAVFQLSAVTYVATGSGARRDRIISTVPFSTVSGARPMEGSVTWSLPKSEKAPAESFLSCCWCCSGCQRQSVSGFDLLHPINGWLFPSTKHIVPTPATGKIKSTSSWNLIGCNFILYRKRGEGKRERERERENCFQLSLFRNLDVYKSLISVTKINYWTTFRYLLSTYTFGSQLETQLKFHSKSIIQKVNGSDIGLL